MIQKQPASQVNICCAPLLLQSHPLILFPLLLSLSLSTPTLLSDRQAEPPQASPQKTPSRRPSSPFPTPMTTRLSVSRQQASRKRPSSVTLNTEQQSQVFQKLTGCANNFIFSVVVCFMGNGAEMTHSYSRKIFSTMITDLTTQK